MLAVLTGRARRGQNADLDQKLVNGRIAEPPKGTFQYSAITSSSPASQSLDDDGAGDGLNQAHLQGQTRGWDITCGKHRFVFDHVVPHGPTSDTDLKEALSNFLETSFETFQSSDRLQTLVTLGTTGSGKSYTINQAVPLFANKIDSILADLASLSICVSSTTSTMAKVKRGAKVINALDKGNGEEQGGAFLQITEWDSTGNAKVLFEFPVGEERGPLSGILNKALKSVEKGRRSKSTNQNQTSSRSILRWAMGTRHLGCRRPRRLGSEDGDGSEGKMVSTQVHIYDLMGREQGTDRLTHWINECYDLIKRGLQTRLYTKHELFLAPPSAAAIGTADRAKSRVGDGRKPIQGIKIHRASLGKKTVKISKESDRGEIRHNSLVRQFKKTSNTGCKELFSSLSRSNTFMAICCIRPNEENKQQTLSTLQLGELFTTLKPVKKPLEHSSTFPMPNTTNDTDDTSPAHRPTVGYLLGLLKALLPPETFQEAVRPIIHTVVDGEAEGEGEEGSAVTRIIRESKIHVPDTVLEHFVVMQRAEEELQELQRMDLSGE